MRRWTLDVELREAAQRVAGLRKRTGKSYVFLRRIAPRLFDEGF